LARFLKFCDKISDVTTYFRSANSAFRLVKSTSGSLTPELISDGLTLIESNADNLIVKQLDNESNIIEKAMTTEELEVLDPVSLKNVDNRVKAIADEFIEDTKKYEDLVEKSIDDLTPNEKISKQSFDFVDDKGSFTTRNLRDILYEQFRIPKGGGTGTKPFLTRKIGQIPKGNQIKDAFCNKLNNIIGMGEIRVNQSHTLVNGKAVGINRPDIQFTYDNKRYYIEIDAPPYTRSEPHLNRIKANDPACVNLTLPVVLQNITIDFGGQSFKLSGGVTLIKFTP
jgi:hypothetical protein